MSDFDYGTKRPDGQYERHPGDPERATKERIRPFRTQYKHEKCGVVTSMPEHCAETYSVNPTFYSRTFCCGCGDYFPVAEFTWLDDGSKVGS